VVVVVVVPAPVNKTLHVKRALCSRANPSVGRTRHPYDTLYRVDERARAPIAHTPTTIYTAHLLYHVLLRQPTASAIFVTETTVAVQWFLKIFVFVI